MVHVINGVLYFNAMDGSSGQELWKHDPSNLGTTSRIYDIRPWLIRQQYRFKNEHGRW